MALYPDAYMMEELMLTVVSALASSIPSILFGIATYVLSSLALYTLATRRGLGRAWLSWIPVLNVWIIGSLSDQYRYVAKGQIKSKRKILLWLNILSAGLSAVMVVLCVVMAADAVKGAMYGLSEEVLTEMILGPVFGILGVSLPLVGIAIAAAVVRYMAMYDVYTSMDPGNSVMFLVLSILFNVTECFFLFFNRNKDEGMPPRRDAPVYSIPQQYTQEPWENKDYL